MKGMKQIFAVVTAVMLYTATFSGCAEEARPKTVRGSKISAETAEFYETWKQTYVTKDPYVSGEMQYYVRYTEDSYAGDSVSVPVTVSEAHGYGMLILPVWHSRMQRQKPILTECTAFIRHIPVISGRILCHGSRATMVLP